MSRECWTYITTNQNHTVLYTGVTSEIKARIKKHREKRYPGSFTARYNADKLVWYELANNMSAAIKREKQIKAGPRAKKIALIEKLNPEWKDLSRGC
jgi:putative endonuclease